ncbi:MAG: secretin N-terminal domain-containing protein [Myxococcota bacterium]
MKSAGKMLGKALLALALAVAPGTQAADFDLYRPKHRTAQELQPLIAPVLGDDGGAVADPGTGTLLISGNAQARARARELLTQLDVPLARYWIDSRIESREALRLQGYELEGEFQLGSLRIERLREPDPPALEPRMHFQELRTDEVRRHQQSLLVTEGRTAELWTGSLVPIRARSFELPDGEQRVLETEPLLAVRTGFQLRPRGLPDGSVELELVAVAARGRSGAELERTSSSTQVRLRPGEWVGVTELSETRTFTGYAPLESAASEWERDELLLFRVRPAAEE